MEDSKQTGSGGNDATDAGEVPSIGVRPTQPPDVATTKSAAKSGGQTTRVRPVEVKMPTSVKEKSSALTELVDSIRDAAKQLANKKDGDTVVIPILIQQEKSGKVNRAGKIDSQTADVEAVELKVPTSAKKMSEILSEFAEKLEDVKKNPKGKQPPIGIILNCNGGDG